MRTNFFIITERSPRRENKNASAEQMHVQMENRLAAIGVRICDDSVTGVRKTFVAGDLCGRQHQMSDKLLLILSRGIERLDMHTRNDQNMRRSLRLDVIERDAPVVFVNDASRNGSFDDLAKYTVLIGHIRY